MSISAWCHSRGQSYRLFGSVTINIIIGTNRDGMAVVWKGLWGLGLTGNPVAAIEGYCSPRGKNEPERLEGAAR